MNTDYQQSEQVNELAAALVAAQKTMRPPVKDAKNPHLKNTYASLSAVRDALLAAYTPAGLALVQMPAIGAPGTASCWTIVTHTSGQWMRSRIEIPWAPQKGLNDAQALGSAYSYARRYALEALTSASTADDDGESAGASQGASNGHVEQRQAAALTVEEVAFIARVDSARTLAELEGVFRPYPKDKRTPAMSAAGNRKFKQLEAEEAAAADA